MASRSEIASQITELIGEGKVRDAYKKFEELPVLDQIAVGVSPGVGDVLTAYEVGEFSTRAKEKVKEGDALGAFGYGALAAIGLASFIPILRFLRGRKAGKLLPEEKKLLPEPLKELPPPAEKISTKIETKAKTKIETPTKSAEEIITNLREKPFSDLLEDGLTVSKMRRAIRNKVGTNYQPNMKIALLLKKLQSGDGVNKAELRSFEVLDEFDQPHPSFVARFGGSQNKVNLDDFDDYLASKGNKYSVVPVKELFEEGASRTRLRRMGNMLGQPTEEIIENSQQRLHLHNDMQKPNSIVNPRGGGHYGQGPNKTPGEPKSIAFDEVAKYEYDFNSPVGAGGEFLGLGDYTDVPNWLRGSKRVYHLQRIQSDYAKATKNALESGKEFASKADLEKMDVTNFIKDYGAEVYQAGILQTKVKTLQKALKNTKDPAEKTKIKNDIKTLQTDIRKSINTLEESIEDMDVTFGLPKFSDVNKPGTKEAFKKYLRKQYYDQYALDSDMVFDRIIKKSDLAKGRVPSTLNYLREIDLDRGKQFIIDSVKRPEDAIFNKIIAARPRGNKLFRSPFDEGGGSKGFTTNYIEPVVRRDLAEAIDEGYDIFRVTSGRSMVETQERAPKVYDELIPNALKKIFKQEGLDPNEYIFQISDVGQIATDTGDSRQMHSLTGTFVKIDDKLREIFKKSGLPTYKKGGIVNLPVPEYNLGGFISAAALLAKLGKKGYDQYKKIKSQRKKQTREERNPDYARGRRLSDRMDSEDVARVLEDHGFSEAEIYGKRQRLHEYEFTDDGKIRAFETQADKLGRVKTIQKTFDSPTIQAVRNYLGY